MASKPQGLVPGSPPLGAQRVGGAMGTRPVRVLPQGTQGPDTRSGQLPDQARPEPAGKALSPALGRVPLTRASSISGFECLCQQRVEGLGSAASPHCSSVRCYKLLSLSYNQRLRLLMTEVVFQAHCISSRLHLDSFWGF